MVINTSFRLAPWADLLYACDLKWWEEHHKEVRECFRGERWSINGTAKSRYGVKLIKGEVKGEGLAPDFIYTGGNGGYQVMGLAVLFGAARLILLGYDMQRTGGKSHWHGDHPNGMGNGGKYEHWVERFGRLAPLLDARGIEVINCSRHTALKCFPRAKIKEVLCPQQMAA